MYAGRHSLERKHERVAAMVGVLAVHLFLGLALVAGFAIRAGSLRAPRLIAFDLAPDPPPPPPNPPPPPRRSERAAPRDAGAPAPKSVPSPRAAPRSVIPLPAPPAPSVAGTGAATSPGAAGAGSGTGSASAGNGAGGGGTAGGGGGIGQPARLIAGGLSRGDYRRIGALAAPSGSARFSLLVGTAGRLTGCQVANSSGDAAVDSTICGLLLARMSWDPARDRVGNPIPVRVYYVATWQRG